MLYGNIVSGFALQSYHKAEEGLVYAASHGYNYWYIDGSLHSDFFDQWTEDRIKKLKAKCEEYNIKPIYHGNFKVPISSDVEVLRLCAVEYVKKEIDLAAMLNCNLIIHGGAIVEPRKSVVVKKMALNNLIKSLKTLKRYADDKGVIIWLENLSHYPDYKPFSYVGTTLEELTFIQSKIKIPLFLDFGHANVNAVNSVLLFFTALHTNIAGVSISNNNGKLDQHLRLENGTIDYSTIVKTMFALGWNGMVAFENRNTNPTASIQGLYALIDSVVRKENLKVV